MKSKRFTLAFGLVLIASLAGCIAGGAISITGSGNVIIRQEDITGFDEVDASHSFKVDIRQGEAFHVIVRIDDNLEKYLQVVKQGATLKIGLEPGRSYNVRKATMEAVVTLPELVGVELSGASQGTVTGFESERALGVELSGASSLRGSIETGDLGCKASGSSTVTLAGSGRNLTVDASGASQVDLSDLAVDDTEVEASGASTVTVNPGGTLDVEASGASRVYYLGNPKLEKINTSGGSSVERK
jgi:hypothetical protein